MSGLGTCQCCHKRPAEALFSANEMAATRGNTESRCWICIWTAQQENGQENGRIVAALANEAPAGVRVKPNKETG